MANITKQKLRAAWQEQKKQTSLKEQYGIAQPNVVVVERKNVLTNILRILLRALGMSLRVASAVSVAVLAVIGLAALIYPDIRGEVVDTGLRIIGEMQSYF